MKKILSVLSVLAITVATTNSVIACSSKNNTESAGTIIPVKPSNIDPITKFFKDFNFKLTINQEKIGVKINEDSYSVKNTLLKLIKDNKAINHRASVFLASLGIVANPLGIYSSDDFNKISINLLGIAANPTTEFGTPNVAPIAYCLKMESNINNQTVLVNGFTKRKEYSYQEITNLINDQMPANTNFNDTGIRNYRVTLESVSSLTTHNKIKDIKMDNIENVEDGSYLLNFLNFIGLGFNQPGNSSNWNNKIESYVTAHSSGSVNQEDFISEYSQYVTTFSFKGNPIIKININGLKQWKS